MWVVQRRVAPRSVSWPFSGRPLRCAPTTAIGIVGTLAGQAAPVAAVLDSALAAKEPVNFHPLHNGATTGLSTEGLMTFLKAVNHEPMIIDLESAV